jgi:uncharacterized protein YigE (DUF2233 family)
MKILIKCVALVLVMIFFGSEAFAKTSWRELSTGLWYTKIPMPTMTGNASVHAFRLDLKEYRLRLALAKEYEGQFATAQNLMLASKGVVGINGGFFSPELVSIGLRISEGELLSRFKPSHWWGVFYIENNRAKIVSAGQYRSSTQIDFAVQAGPRLVVDGHIPKLRPGVANRSALGIRRDGQVIVLATQNVYLSTDELAKIMQRTEAEEGLACWQAINLDGGSSTQLYAKVSDFELSISSFMPVADVVVVMPREKLR